MNAYQLELLARAVAGDSVASQLLFESMTSPWHRVDTRRPCDLDGVS